MAERVPEETRRLAKLADALGRTAMRRKPEGWPSLWLFTDPERTPDLIGAAKQLPRGTGIVLRTFGRADVEAVACELSGVAQARGLSLLVAADERLAARIGADGMHLPERMIDRLPRVKARWPRWRFTAAAHSRIALDRAALAGADAAFLSPVFPSLSPSAGSPLGPTRAALLVRAATLPVYALGGVDVRTAAGLRSTGVCGVSGVGFSGPPARLDVRT